MGSRNRNKLYDDGVIGMESGYLDVEKQGIELESSFGD